MVGEASTGGSPTLYLSQCLNPLFFVDLPAILNIHSRTRIPSTLLFRRGRNSPSSSPATAFAFFFFTSVVFVFIWLATYRFCPSLRYLDSLQAANSTIQKRYKVLRIAMLIVLIAPEPPV